MKPFTATTLRRCGKLRYEELPDICCYCRLFLFFLYFLYNFRLMCYNSAVQFIFKESSVMVFCIAFADLLLRSRSSGVVRRGRGRIHTTGPGHHLNQRRQCRQRTSRERVRCRGYRLRHAFSRSPRVYR
jgi:hypothetical protein